jgi:hypothetical protein
MFAHAAATLRTDYLSAWDTVEVRVEVPMVHSQLRNRKNELPVAGKEELIWFLLEQPGVILSFGAGLPGSPPFPYHFLSHSAFED